MSTSWHSDLELPTPVMRSSLLFFLTVASLTVCADVLDGRVVSVADGDTITLLDAGLAWWYRKYAHEQLPRDRIDYEAVEDRAADRVGLWQDANPVPPWEW